MNADLKYACSIEIPRHSGWRHCNMIELALIGTFIYTLYVVKYWLYKPIVQRHIIGDILLGKLNCRFIMSRVLCIVINT